MAAPRRLAAARGGLASFAVEGGDAGPPLPWDIVREKLEELLRFLAAALGDWASAVARWARSALAVAAPAAAVVALVVVLCCCCGYCCVSSAGGGGGRRRRRGPDGEEAGGEGPVVSYRGGGYRGGIFSLHPNKPIRG